MYRKKDPESEDEIELLENMFDALCSALMEAPNKEQFRTAEGFELMLMMVKYAQTLTPKLFSPHLACS